MTAITVLADLARVFSSERGVETGKKGARSDSLHP